MATPEEIVRSRLASEATNPQAQRGAAKISREHDLARIRHDAVQGCQAAVAVLAEHGFAGAELVKVEINHGGFLRDRIERFERAAWKVTTEQGRWMRDSHEQITVWLGADLRTYRRSGEGWTVAELADEHADVCRAALQVLGDLSDEYTVRMQNREVDLHIAQAFGLTLEEVSRALDDAMSPEAARLNTYCPLTVDEAALSLVRSRLRQAREWLETGRSPDDLAGLPTRDTPPAQWNLNASVTPRFNGVYELDRSVPQHASFSYLRFYPTGFVCGTTIGELDPVRPQSQAVRVPPPFRYLRVDNDRLPSEAFQLEGRTVSFELSSRFSQPTAVRGQFSEDGTYLEAASPDADFQGLWTFVFAS
ncbi:hypothetical protein SK803_42655 [Lentzea sp. BCCO 10_0856]|uniref:DUF222 domain-containing protein n=1 Tax=Lentzea miocenica TaxID=3095431 RepID=A0ABU4TGD6_9PSEU|nr:hypothetical protein [Lentzea sp. BCCO 10_0856]MDX8036938.1 hypothetical protein [Lentzea sp. BCCO 10_0856]